MTEQHRLVTIGVSHYCEKARWALDRSGVDYVEDAHLPVFHQRAVKRLVRGKRRQVPVLVTPGGDVLQDSTGILRHLDGLLPEERRLFPAAGDPATAEVEALEDDFDRRLGPAARLVAYHHLLPHLRRFVGDVSHGVPRWEVILFYPIIPLGRRLIRRGYRITPERVAEARRRIDATFAEVADRLEDGRPFLLGARFTAADLTFAALAGPLLNVGPRGPLLAPDKLPEGLQALVATFKAHPAGAFALRLYREHRADGPSRLPLGARSER